MILKLVVRSEAYSGPEELLLCESSYGIGRRQNNDVSIQNNCVSGYHAELNRTPDGGYTIRDLKSTNGTFLNGIRVTSPEKVKPGDRLKLGNLLITFEEHIEVVTQPENESFPEGFPSNIVSLKDVFGFESGENFNTPISPISAPPALGNGSEVPKQPVRMEEPAQGSGMAAQEIERAREAERLQQLERAREAERIEVDLREKPEPAGKEDFRSKIQSLTAQIESAMREINRLSAFITRESPNPVEMNTRSAGPVNPSQPLPSSREEHAMPPSEILDGKGMPTGQMRVAREGDREEVRAGSHNNPPFQSQNSENEVALRTDRKPRILSTVQLRQQLEAARSAGGRLAGNETGLRGDNAGLIS